MHEPLKGDLPRKVLIESATTARIDYGVDICNVFFKFTCSHCGHRCMFQEPNKLYESGECSECGKATEVQYGGYMLQITTHVKKGDY